jgi:hypothetical protein
LWDESDEAPVYLGDEYLLPLVGRSELARHWQRVGARLESLSFDSHVAVVRFHEAHFASLTCLTDWSVRTFESPDVRTGRSWMTMLARLTAAGWRIVHSSETPVYAGSAFEPPPTVVSYLRDAAVEIGSDAS